MQILLDNGGLIAYAPQNCTPKHPLEKKDIVMN